MERAIACERGLLKGFSGCDAQESSVIGILIDFIFGTNDNMNDPH
jgi:hypothetical protein